MWYFSRPVVLPGDWRLINASIIITTSQVPVEGNWGNHQCV